MKLVNDQRTTSETAARAFQLMEEHHIIPSPTNYEVWYSYAKEDKPDLKKALDVLIRNDHGITDVICNELHDKYFVQDNLRVADEMQAVGDQMQAHLDGIIENIGISLDDTSLYGRTLEAASGKLDQTKADNSTRALIDTLIAATRQMKMRSTALEERLAETNREVNNLQTSLQSIRQEALTDQLTNLGNRKAFDEALRDEAGQAMENGENLSLIFCDIDHFKKFNDDWGHQTGDNVLKLVASMIRSNVKGQDIAARYGGEEFAIILPQTDLHGARQLADQIRYNVENKKLQRKSTGESLGTVTISMGVALYRPGEPLTEFVHRADSCLYAAKRSGRNRVICERDPEFSLVGDLAKGAA